MRQIQRPSATSRSSTLRATDCMISHPSSPVELRFAETITIVLPFRASLSLLTVFSASVNMDSVDSNSLLTVVTPQESNNCFSTSACDVSATIGRGGLYFETLRAVFPVRVGVTIAAADI